MGLGLNVVNRAAIARVSGLIGRRKRTTEEASRTSVTVGIHEEEGGETVDGGQTIAEIGLYHELGTSRVPRRSWLADTIDEEQSRIDEALRRVGREIAAARMRPDVAYLQLGEFIVAKIQGRIRRRIPPPLAPSTIAAKGSDVPLIDEGRLIASIRSRVRESSA